MDAPLTLRAGAIRVWMYCARSCPRPSLSSRWAELMMLSTGRTMIVGRHLRVQPTRHLYGHGDCGCSGGWCSGGHVMFKDGPVNLGVGTLAAGKAKFTSSSLAPGK